MKWYFLAFDGSSKDHYTFSFLRTSFDFFHLMWFENDLKSERSRAKSMKKRRTVLKEIFKLL